MPENYRLIINDDAEINVRLVGIIDEKECEAIMNLDDGMKKVVTAESINIDDTTVPSPFGRRFVIIVRDYKVKLAKETDAELTEYRKNMVDPKLFVSAVVKRMSYVTKNKVLHTHDGNKYQFVPITKSAGVHT